MKKTTVQSYIGMGTYVNSCKVLAEEVTILSDGGPEAALVKLRDLYLNSASHYSGVDITLHRKSMTDPKVHALWTRVYSACVASGASLEEFVSAQFHWFHNKFRKPPTVVQMTTKAATQRAVEWSQSKRPQFRPVSSGLPSGVDLFTKHKYASMYVEKMMAAHKMTREELYERLVKTGEVVLPKEFLADDPVWQKVNCG